MSLRRTVILMPEIYDIHRARPSREDKYFVDTNVWFWLTYCSSKEIPGDGEPRRYQVTKYPEFIEKVLDMGARLFHCPLVYSELANIIERTEFNIYRIENPQSKVSRKVFRSMSEERENVLKELKIAWDTISQLSKCLEVPLHEKFVQDAHEVLEGSTLDPYDAFYFQIMAAEGLTKIITDDRDFGSTEIDSIYTANNRILN
jgi:predicted nucleic acid-binding protein